MVLQKLTILGYFYHIETDHFHLKPLRFSLETPDFHWRPQDFYWSPPELYGRPPDLHGRPQILIRRPKVLFFQKMLIQVFDHLMLAKKWNIFLCFPTYQYKFSKVLLIWNLIKTVNDSNILICPFCLFRSIFSGLQFSKLKINKNRFLHSKFWVDL